MVLNIPADLAALEQADVFNPISSVFPPSPPTNPLEIRKSSYPQPPLPVAPAPKISVRDSASMRRSSSIAPSTKAWSTTATYGDSDSEEMPVTRRPSILSSLPVPTRGDSERASMLSRHSSRVSSSSPSSAESNPSFVSRPIFGHPLSLAPLPTLPSLGCSSGKATNAGLHSNEGHQSKFSAASPFPKRRPLSAALPDTSFRSSNSRSNQDDTGYTLPSHEEPKHRLPTLIEQSPKSAAASVADLNDNRLRMVRDKAAAGNSPLADVPSSPREVEPLSSARRTDFEEDQACITPPRREPAFAPAVKLQLAQSSVYPPKVVPKSEIPKKKLRWDTRR